MRRREFLGAMSGMALVGLSAAHAQQPTRRVAVQLGGDTMEARSRAEALRGALRGLGWIDGQNVRIDLHWSGSDLQVIERQTAEMIATKPDVIVSGTSIGIAQILRTAASIPIVFAAITDPVGQGFVASLARPGGNATGFAAYEASLGGKWIESLKEISPSLKSAAIVYEPQGAPYMAGMARSVAAGGPAFGVDVKEMTVRDVGELESAIATLGQQPNAGLIIPPAGFTLANFKLIIALTAKHRLPAVYAFRSIVTAGGLISYGVDAVDQYARAAAYVDRVLRGTKPSDLPVQGPIKFELAVNLKTAKTLGLTVPPSLLARADEVIE